MSGQTITGSLDNYTYDTYVAVLQELIDTGFEFRSFENVEKNRVIFLRHDVDLSAESALKMAQIEADLGIKSTYFFLVSDVLYNIFEQSVREKITEIKDLGHDIGLHFSTHQYWQEKIPPEDELIMMIEREQEALSLIINDLAETISFHIPPDWVLGRTIPGVCHTYEDRYMTEIQYRADSSTRWMDEPPFPNGLADKVQLLCHPGLWNNKNRSFEEAVHEAKRSSLEKIENSIHSQYLD